MIEKIESVLANFKDITGWKIVENHIKSRELFFVKKELDMSRAKEVQKYKVTVYKDFTEDGIKYKGSSEVAVHPTMDEAEIESVIKGAAFSAGYVKSKYYPLVKGRPSAGKTKDVSLPELKQIDEMSEAVYKNDVNSDGWINSCELFLNNDYTRIVNSEGVDVSYTGSDGLLELVVDWKGLKEEVELFKYVNFAGDAKDILSENVRELLDLAKNKAVAKPTPSLRKSTVLLTRESVPTFFKYYFAQSGARGVYDNISQFKVGETVQGENVQGDYVNMVLDPCLKNSSDSRPYDNDGIELKPVLIIENGILKRYWGDAMHSYYLNIEPTGSIKNIVVKGGSKSIDDMKKEPYLELLAFSDFQMDEFTGYFAGEIRFGWYFDGNKKIPVTGGSISGSIQDVQKNMFLSKETSQQNNFYGPKTIQLFNVSVAGN